jgi:membrane associated rhomboid family serine protease
MKTVSRKYSQSSIPNYDQNAVLQLIVASAVGFITYHLARVILLIVEAQPTTFPSYFTENVSLPAIEMYTRKFWTVLTYGWVHNGFWELFSNMIWLYTFGSVVQMLVGHRQVIPLFVYGLIIGGLFYQGCQLIPGAAFNVQYSLLGAYAGVTALATAALTLAPDYKFYLGERFGVPIMVVAIIFYALMIMGSNLEAPRLFLLAGGAATGFGYVKLMNAGYKPGMWVYNMFDWLERLFTPGANAAQKHHHKRNRVLQNIQEPRYNNRQKRVDELLDKINQGGYDSLSKEEKEFLMNAGKENDK